MVGALGADIVGVVCGGTVELQMKQHLGVEKMVDVRLQVVNYYAICFDL